MFPIDVTIKRKIRGKLNPDQRKEALQHVAVAIRKKEANNIIVSGDFVTCKGSTSWSRNALFKKDGGRFSFVDEGPISYLVFDYSQLTLFIFAASFSVIAGIVAGIANNWWIGIIMFLWMFGANWVTSHFRYGVLVSEIAGEISDTNFGKEQYYDQPEVDKMAAKGMKNWM